ncbi:hypothetical protein BOX15_Mlig019449g1 [Macrostomum lignano]|uniref:Uncharacterized protein n=1 Tax=Macrostomum lignano TaxID=282301 RepID=A0A267H1M1_9PLAT|nr:hypothetical protein BOX15_Mlig019449g1 [Macrostomum lignano]
MTGLLQNSTPLLLLCCLAAAINVSAGSFCTYNFAKLVQHTWTMPEGFASYDVASNHSSTNASALHVPRSVGDSTPKQKTAAVQSDSNGKCPANLYAPIGFYNQPRRSDSKRSIKKLANETGVTESTTHATNKTTGHVTASSANSQCPNTKLMLAAELFSSASQRKSTRKQK